MIRKTGILVVFCILAGPHRVPASSPLAPEEKWLAPPPIEQTNSGKINTTIVKGVAVPPSPTPSPTPTPSRRPETKAAKERLIITAYPVPYSPSELSSAITQQSEARVAKSEDAALPGDKRSLVAFYSIRGEGERTLVKFSSKLSLPDGRTLRNSVSIFAPADGSPRIVPLFYGMEVSPSTLPGEYSMDWVAEEPASGYQTGTSAKFLRAADVGSAKVNAAEGRWQGLPTKETSSKFDPKAKISKDEKSPPLFDNKGVGIKKDNKTEYKFETKTPPSQKTKKPSGGFSTPKPPKKKNN
jgi:hypothetical protein